MKNQNSIAPKHATTVPGTTKELWASWASAKSDEDRAKLLTKYGLLRLADIERAVLFGWVEVSALLSFEGLSEFGGAWGEAAGAIESAMNAIHKAVQDAREKVGTLTAGD